MCNFWKCINFFPTLLVCLLLVRFCSLPTRAKSVATFAADSRSLIIIQFVLHKSVLLLLRERNTNNPPATCYLDSANSTSGRRSESSSKLSAGTLSEMLDEKWSLLRLNLNDFDHQLCQFVQTPSKKAPNNNNWAKCRHFQVLFSEIAAKLKIDSRIANRRKLIQFASWSKLQMSSLILTCQVTEMRSHNWVERQMRAMQFV